MNELKYNTFKKLEGQQVEVCDANGQQVSMKVTAVDQYDMQSSRWQGWSMLLETDQPTSIADGSYQLRHPTIGGPLLHLSAKGEAYYEIVVTEARDAE